MLSSEDIKKELIGAKNIAIHPLVIENIKGSSINLTASLLAWDTQTKESIYCKDTTQSGEQNKTKGKLYIHPGQTVSIFTTEAVWISRRIGGTYHPRVSMVAKGLSNISTTLDPQWHGLSLITFQNTLPATPGYEDDKNKDPNTVFLREGEPFVTLQLFYLKTPAKKGIIDNQASRPDLHSKFNKTPEQEELLDSNWHRNYYGIVKKMLDSESYSYLRRDVSRTVRLLDFFQTNLGTALITTLGALLGVVLTLIFQTYFD